MFNDDELGNGHGSQSMYCPKAFEGVYVNSDGTCCYCNEDTPFVLLRDVLKEARMQGDALSAIFTVLLEDRAADDLSERERAAADIAAEALAMLTSKCPHEERVKELEAQLQSRKGE